MTAVNNMLIDMLATMARQNFETRRARQKQGIEKAKEHRRGYSQHSHKSLHVARLRKHQYHAGRVFHHSYDSL